MPKILILGQAPPSFVVDRPFGRTRLYDWFKTIGISQEEMFEKCIFTATLEYFPGRINGKDRVPTQTEVEANLPRLRQILVENDIKLIVPVGKTAIGAVFGIKVKKLADFVGREFFEDPFSNQNSPDKKVKIVPLPYIPNLTLLLGKCISILMPLIVFHYCMSTVVFFDAVFYGVKLCLFAFPFVSNHAPNKLIYLFNHESLSH